MFVPEQPGPAEPALSAGTVVDGRFVLEERIGAGSGGAVYRARDKKLERPVAFKLVSPAGLTRLAAEQVRLPRGRESIASDLTRLAAEQVRLPRGRESIASGARSRGRERAVRAFLREARAQARLPHPHVLVVHDVRSIRRLQGAGSAGELWLGAPYIVSELLEGRTLRAELHASRDRLAAAGDPALPSGDPRSGPLALGRALSLLAQICDAVACAHEAAIVHRDLKPENIFVCAGDRAKVLDFGLARSRAFAAGTPGYMAPEQEAGAEPAPSMDSYALGVIAFEMIAGARPVAGEELRVPGAPLALARLIARCLSPIAEERPEALELLHELWRIEAAHGRNKRLSSAPSEECPFPGLRAFAEREARWFFGRPREIKQCIDALGSRPGRRWLAIEGASGSGKSSLVRAGLIPALESGGLRDGPGRWRVAQLRPGIDPLGNLRRALSAAFDAETPRKRALLESVLEGREGLPVLVDSLLPAGEALVICVDQLEELFTLPENAAAAVQVDRILASALAPDNAPPIYLITTLRSDFVDAYRALPQLFERLNEGASRYHLAGMSVHGLQQAVLGPAALAGLSFDEGLPERIVAEAGGGEGALPLVAHLLRALWDSCPDGQIAAAKYEALGGIAGAIGSTADRALASLDEEGRKSARELLLALVRTNRGGRETRRVITRAQALEAAGGGARADAVLDLLAGGPRLIVISGGGANEEARVELAHEALLSDWPALAGWVREAHRALERRDDLEAAAAAWVSAGRPADGLARGAQLAYFEGAASPSLSAREYLAAARALMEKLERDRDRGMRRRVGALSAGVLVLACLLAWAVRERERADTSRVAALEVADTLARQIDGQLNALPGSQGVRAELLDTTTKLLERLGDDREALRALAINRRLGGTFASSSGRGDIIRELEGAAMLGRALAAKDPADVGAQLELAKTLTRLRYETYMANWVSESTAYAEEVVALVAPIHRQHPEHAEVTQVYAQALGNLADAYSHAGSAERAVAVAREAIDALLALPELDRGGLAELEAVMMRALRVHGEHAEAIGWAEAKLELAQAALAAEPESQAALRVLVWAHVFLADCLIEAGRFEEAAREGRAAAALGARNDEAEPSVYLLYRDTRIAAEQRLAAALLRAGKVSEARAHFAKSVELTEDARRTGSVMPHHLVRGYAGLCAAAMEEGDALAALDLCAEAIADHQLLVEREVDGRYVLLDVAPAYLAQARAYAALGRFEKAIDVLAYPLRTMRLLVERNATDGAARNLYAQTQSILAGVLRAQGRIGAADAAAAAAVHAWMELVELGPDHADLRRALEMAAREE